MDSINLIRTLKFLPGIIIGLTVHEFSHAFVAQKCGDTTARDQGRVTLNPLKHIDLLGFILLLVAGFGWAKPVEFNEQNLKNPKTDVLKIAVAGPLSNALVAIVLSVIFMLWISAGIDHYARGNRIFMEILRYGIYINWGLFIFNLIPLPPLDGSHLLLSYFKKYPALYTGLYKYGSLLLFALIIGSVFTKINLFPIWPLIQFLGDGFLALFGFHF
ncbi:MAG: site-2 protease family protein [Bacteroidia bacterium]|jgi:Zn-dependent protease|nr:site-2 protease family protein [Bacteroidia bacterium]